MVTLTNLINFLTSFLPTQLDKLFHGVFGWSLNDPRLLRLHQTLNTIAQPFIWLRDDIVKPIATVRYPVLNLFLVYFVSGPFFEMICLVFADEMSIYAYLLLVGTWFWTTVGFFTDRPTPPDARPYYWWERWCRHDVLHKFLSRESIDLLLNSLLAGIFVFIQFFFWDWANYKKLIEAWVLVYWPMTLVFGFIQLVLVHFTLFFVFGYPLKRKTLPLYAGSGSASSCANFY